MKIGYFDEKFPYFSLRNEFEIYPYGGGEIVAYNLAVNVAKKGNEVLFFTTSATPKNEVEKKWGITIHRYGTLFRLFRRNISLGLLLKPNVNVDIVHAHIGSEPFVLIAAIKYAKKKKTPLVVTYHGDTIAINKNIAYKIAVYFNNLAVRRILDLANAIIVPSEHYIDESIVLPKYRDKIVVIPNGINVDEFDIGYSKEECRERLGLPVNEKIILFVGVILPHKGPDILLKAMPKILTKVPDAKLIFVGSGAMGEELERLSKKLGIEKNVKFVGFIGDTFKKTLYYKATDVFVLPSFLEMFPIVSLEAMTCSVPIIASKIGGIPDVVKDGENGLLVPPKDSEALADAIIYLLENEEVRKEMGKNARKKIEKYSWERIAEMTEKVYNGIIS